MGNTVWILMVLIWLDLKKKEFRKEWSFAGQRKDVFAPKRK